MYVICRSGCMSCSLHLSKYHLTSGLWFFCKLELYLLEKRIMFRAFFCNRTDTITVALKHDTPISYLCVTCLILFQNFQIHDILPQIHCIPGINCYFKHHRSSWLIYYFTNTHYIATVSMTPPMLLLHGKLINVKKVLFY